MLAYLGVNKTFMEKLLAKQTDTAGCGSRTNPCPPSGFGPTKPVSFISPPVAPPTPSTAQPVTNLAANNGVNTGVVQGIDARKFIEENRNEIIQIVVVSALIAIGFHLLDK